MKVQVTFRSGAQIVFDAEDVTIRHERITGELGAIKWVHSEDAAAAKLLTIEHLGEIVAIVRLAGEPT